MEGEILENDRTKKKWGISGQKRIIDSILWSKKILWKMEGNKNEKILGYFVHFYSSLFTHVGDGNRLQVYMAEEKLPLE